MLPGLSAERLASGENTPAGYQVATIYSTLCYPTPSLMSLCLSALNVQRHIIMQGQNTACDARISLP